MVTDFSPQRSETIIELQKHPVFNNILVSGSIPLQQAYLEALVIIFGSQNPSLFSGQRHIFASISIDTIINKAIRNDDLRQKAYNLLHTLLGHDWVLMVLGRTL